jgi:type II secretory pathway pseudopilin PulG
MDRQNKGYTIIEIIGVMVIVAILASTIYPRMMSFKSNANEASIKKLEATINSSILAAHSQALAESKTGEADSIVLDGVTTGLQYAYPSNAGIVALVGTPTGIDVNSDTADTASPDVTAVNTNQSVPMGKGDVQYFSGSLQKGGGDSGLGASDIFACDSFDRGYIDCGSYYPNIPPDTWCASYKTCKTLVDCGSSYPTPPNSTSQICKTPVDCGSSYPTAPAEAQVCKTLVDCGSSYPTPPNSTSQICKTPVDCGTSYPTPSNSTFQVCKTPLSCGDSYPSLPSGFSSSVYVCKSLVSCGDSYPVLPDGYSSTLYDCKNLVYFACYDSNGGRIQLPYSSTVDYVCKDVQYVDCQSTSKPADTETTQYFCKTVNYTRCDDPDSDPVDHGSSITYCQQPVYYDCGVSQQLPDGIIYPIPDHPNPTYPVCKELVYENCGVGGSPSTDDTGTIEYICKTVQYVACPEYPTLPTGLTGEDTNEYVCKTPVRCEDGVLPNGQSSDQYVCKEELVVDCGDSYPNPPQAEDALHVYICSEPPPAVEEAASGDPLCDIDYVMCTDGVPQTYPDDTPLVYPEGSDLAGESAAGNLMCTGQQVCDNETGDLQYVNNATSNTAEVLRYEDASDQTPAVDEQTEPPAAISGFAPAYSDYTLPGFVVTANSSTVRFQANGATDPENCYLSYQASSGPGLAPTVELEFSGC